MSQHDTVKQPLLLLLQHGPALRTQEGGLATVEQQGSQSLLPQPSQQQQQRTAAGAAFQRVHLLVHLQQLKASLLTLQATPL
jgi:hypothetical protein